MLSAERSTSPRPVARPCRSCGTLVYDLIHVGTLRRAPIEVQAVIGGNIVIDLVAGSYRMLGRDFRDETPHYVNHFATCKDARRFRGR